MSNVPYDPTHPVYEVEAVIVPAKGEFFVRDGKVIEVVESKMVASRSDFYAYTVWVQPEEDDDE